MAGRQGGEVGEVGEMVESRVETKRCVLGRKGSGDGGREVAYSYRSGFIKSFSKIWTCV